MKDEHTLEYLLAFDGRLHRYAGGYYIKFEIKRVPPSPERPHGLRYSFTLHASSGARLIGFDNAHAVVPKGSRFKPKALEADHWHRTKDDPGRPYEFVSAEKLLDDFFDEVERVLGEHGVAFDVVEVEERNEE